MKGRCIGRRAASSAIVLLLAATLGAQESSLFDRLISDREDTRERAIDEAMRLAPPIRQQLITRLIERLPSKGLDSYFASLTLGRFGESAVASLIGAVHSDNPDVRYRASEALGRIGAPALDPVTAVLSDPSAELRCAASHALELMRAGAIKAVPILTPLLSTGSSDLTRCVVKSLGAIGSDDALSALRSELKIVEFQGETLNALAAMRDHAAAATEEVLPLLKSTNPSIRYIAARTVGEIAPPSTGVVNALIGALSDTDTGTRQQAAEALGKLGAPAAAAVPPLRQLINGTRRNEDALVVQAAVEALGKIGAAAKDAAPEIISLWRAMDLFVRRASEEAIAGIGASAMPALIEALRDAHPEIRSGAAWQLGELNAAEAVPGLAQALRDTDATVRVAARRALGKMNHPQAQAALAQTRASNAIVPRLLTLAEVETAISPADGHRSARSLVSRVDLAGPPGISLLATIHRADDDGDLVRIWKPVGQRYRLIRTIEDKNGDSIPSVESYEPLESFRLRGETFIHVMLLSSGTGYIHDDTILWVAPDGTLYDVKFVPPAASYKSQLRKGEGVWKGEVNVFTSAEASFRFGIWRDGDRNCCPSGGQVSGHYTLVGQKRYNAATKRWSADFRIEPADFMRSTDQR